MASWSLTYYNTRVEHEVDNWPAGIRADYLRIMGMVTQYGPNLGLPHTRAMSNGLFEIRAKGREGIGRALYCTIVDRRIIILHAFVKKTERTPRQHLDLAETRRKEVLKHGT